MILAQIGCPSDPILPELWGVRRQVTIRPNYDDITSGD